MDKSLSRSAKLLVDIRAEQERTVLDWLAAECDTSQDAAGAPIAWEYATVLRNAFKHWSERTNRASVTPKMLCLVLERNGVTRWQERGIRVFRGVKLLVTVDRPAVEAVVAKSGRAVKELVRDESGLTARERFAIRGKLCGRDAAGNRTYPADWPYTWR